MFRKDGVAYVSVDRSLRDMQVASWLNTQHHRPEGALVYHDMQSDGERIRLTQVNKRKMSSIRNLFRIMILETMRAVISTVEIANMTQVIITRPSPML